MSNPTNKVVLITGGSRGIGLGIAEALLADGYLVAITARVQSSLDRAMLDLNDRFPNKVIGIVSDVRSMESQQEGVEQVLSKWGRIDVLIANAGIGFFADIDELEPEQWKETIDTNLSGVFYSLKSCLAALKSSKGYFITIASLAGANFFPKGAAYNASKFGLVGFTQAAMLDLRKHGIKTSTIMPGSVATEFNQHVPGPEDSWKIQPEDIGKIVVDLLNMPERTLPSKVEVRPSFPKS